MVARLTDNLPSLYVLLYTVGDLSVNRADRAEFAPNTNVKRPRQQLLRRRRHVGSQRGSQLRHRGFIAVMFFFFAPPLDYEPQAPGGHTKRRLAQTRTTLGGTTASYGDPRRQHGPRSPAVPHFDLL
jgi:hypothetical protein